jgi:hypothetical protein
MTTVKFCFQFQLRRYTKSIRDVIAFPKTATVGRSRLTMSDPVLKAPVGSALKAPMVSALESIHMIRFQLLLSYLSCAAT